MERQQNKYDFIILPLNYNQSFLELSKDEIENYYKWFKSIKNERLAQLQDFLFSRGAAKNLHEEDLHVIEQFLMNSVSAIKKSKDQFQSESEKIPDHLKPYAKPDDYILDNNTISICYDIGIFMGELLIKIDGSITWKLEKNKKFADYGQPFLYKKGCKLGINPFRVAKNLAAKIYEGTYTEGQIISVFEAWKKGYGSGQN